MEKAPREEVEREVRRLHDAGDLAAAAAAALRGYGPEIFGFLVAFHRDESDAAEVFSLFTERLWRGLGAFAWECSFRTWAFVLARNESLRYRRDERRRAARNRPLPSGSALSAIEEQVRTETLPYLRTQTRTRVAELRDSLPPEDRMLLVLRVDKQLAWNDLARVMHDGVTPLTEEQLKKDAARLRKRFQLIKDRLLERARKEGLLPDDG